MNGAAINHSAPHNPHSPLAKWRSPLRIGSVELASRFTLAPLAGYTNLPFRLNIRELGGVGLCTTDLVNARAVLDGSRKTMELLSTSPQDRPLAVQIYGANADEMARGAQWLEAYGATLIDINMGCPVRKVVRGGGGSAMMCDTSGATVELIRHVVEAVKIPVTVKMRLGWDDQNLSAPLFARAFEQAGVAAVTIHGRTRAQGFTGGVNLDGIRAVVEAVERIPVIGNGDVRTIADAERMLLSTGCAGVAVGRGALANPWIFRQLHSWLQLGAPSPRGGYGERLRFMEMHLQRLIEWRGEHLACLQFRKVATWYCKALRTGRAVQQALVQLDTWETFQRIIEPLREAGPPPGWGESDASSHIAVPAGPIAHW
jgi:tRNA-dihydrouridine synthase B